MNKLCDVLSDEKKWTKGAYARKADGVPPEDIKNGECFCLLGAAIKCGLTTLQGGIFEHQMYNLIVSKYPYADKQDRFTTIIEFNDEVATFDQIKELACEYDNTFGDVASGRQPELDEGG